MSLVFHQNWPIVGICSAKKTTTSYEHSNSMLGLMTSAKGSLSQSARTFGWHVLALTRVSTYLDHVLCVWLFMICKQKSNRMSHKCVPWHLYAVKTFNRFYLERRRFVAPTRCDRKQFLRRRSSWFLVGHLNLSGRHHGGDTFGGIVEFRFCVTCTYWATHPADLLVELTFPSILLFTGVWS